jgi:hypothetical protein
MTEPKDAEADASETKDRDDGQKRRAVEQLRAKALGKFGIALMDAGVAYEKALEELAGKGEAEGATVGDVSAIPEYNQANALATFLGYAFFAAAARVRDGEKADFQLAYDDRRKLARVYKALRPRVDGQSTGEAVEIAASIIDRYGQIFQHASSVKERPAPPAPYDGWMTSEQIARALPNVLAVEVHPTFRQLDSHPLRIGELLARWIPRTPRERTGRHARNAKDGVDTRMTAAGILCELNALVRFPLGAKLNANTVESMIKRFRK